MLALCNCCARLACDMRAFVPNYKTSETRRGFKVEWWQGGRHHSHTFKAASERLAWIRRRKAEDNAKKHIEKTALRAGEYVSRFAHLPIEWQSAALHVVDSIKAVGGTDEDARAAAIEYCARMGAGMTVAEAVDGHLRSIAWRSSSTIRERRRLLALFQQEIGVDRLCALTRAACKAWVEVGTKQNQAHRHAALSALLRWCVREEHLRASPLDGVKKASVDIPDEVEILSAEDAEKVLRTAQEVAPRLVPYFAIGIFAGLRPERELRLLEDKDIDLEHRSIYVRRSHAKTRRDRLVPISENLHAWLVAYPVDGRVDYSRSAMRRTVARAGVKWSADIMRHTRASFRYAETLDDGRVAGEMGHGISVLHRHYANSRIHAEDVRRFWGIVP